MRTAGLIENRRKTAAQPSRRLLERRACKDCPEEQAPIGAFFIHRIRGCRTDFPGISCTILKPASYTYGTDSYSPIISCGTERIMVCSWHLLIAFASMIEENFLNAAGGVSRLLCPRSVVMKQCSAPTS